MKLIRGFTLLELLVVIAVIAILATVVIMSYPSARGKGNDAGVKADLATIQVQAVQYFGIGNTYGVLNTGSIASCSTSGTVFNDTATTIDGPVQSAVASAQKSANGGSSQVYCRSNASSFVVAAKLSSGAYWCVDSKGNMLEKNTAPDTGSVDCAY